jgi:hypothetical protein
MTDLTDKVKETEITKIEFEQRYKEYLKRLEKQVNISSNNYNSALRAYNTYNEDLVNHSIRYLENDRNEILYTKKVKKKIGF